MGFIVNITINVISNSTSSFFAQASTAPQTSTVEKIPVRATLLSALSIVPFVLVLIAVFLSNLKQEDIGMWGHLAMLALDAIRCPTIGSVKI